MSEIGARVTFDIDRNVQPRACIQRQLHVSLQQKDVYRTSTGRTVQAWSNSQLGRAESHEVCILAPQPLRSHLAASQSLSHSLQIFSDS